MTLQGVPGGPGPPSGGSRDPPGHPPGGVRGAFRPPVRGPPDSPARPRVTPRGPPLPGLPRRSRARSRAARAGSRTPGPEGRGNP